MSSASDFEPSLSGLDLSQEGKLLCYFAANAPVQDTSLTSGAASAIVGRPMPEWKPYMSSDEAAAVAYKIDQQKFRVELQAALRIAHAEAMVAALKSRGLFKTQVRLDAESAPDETFAFESDGGPKWKPDCCGKQDYDFDIVTLSCRLYPQGGSFLAISPGGECSTREDRPWIKPSAVASILVGGSPVYRASFEAATEEDVKADVESWAKAAMARVEYAVRKEFAGVDDSSQQGSCDAPSCERHTLLGRQEAASTTSATDGTRGEGEESEQATFRPQTCFSVRD